MRLTVLYMGQIRDEVMPRAPEPLKLRPILAAPPPTLDLTMRFLAGSLTLCA